MIFGMRRRSAASRSSHGFPAPRGFRGRKSQMINHPNRRKKVYPDHTFANEQRALGKNVQYRWTVSGYAKSDAEWLTCYAVDDGDVIVETLREGRGYVIFRPTEFVLVVPSAAISA
jgi:hypothetical protein